MQNVIDNIIAQRQQERPSVNDLMQKAGFLNEEGYLTPDYQPDMELIRAADGPLYERG